MFSKWISPSLNVALSLTSCMILSKLLALSITFLICKRQQRGLLTELNVITYVEATDMYYMFQNGSFLSYLGMCSIWAKPKLHIIIQNST